MKFGDKNLKVGIWEKTQNSKSEILNRLKTQSRF